MIFLRFVPSTNSITMKKLLSDLPMSKTLTMFACVSRAPSRASSRNIPMKFVCEARWGNTRLIATRFLKP